MSKLIKKFKKSVAIVLSVTTFAWAIGPVALLMPTRVLAADATAGDLIKMEGLDSVYYLGGDSKRYVFPNETTYKSWYSDFAGVKTVSQAELESYSLSGVNATIRPGTKLVKITTDPKVYAIETGGIIKWIPDEATAITLYGADWAGRVVDVPDAFFGNYTVSDEQISADAYPEGTLIQYEGSSDIYLVTSATEARKVATMDAMEANNYELSNVVTAPATITYTSGTEVTAIESSLVDLSDTGVVPTVVADDTTTTAGSGLTIALASDTAAAASIIADSTSNEYPQASIPFTKVNFTAGADGDVKVTNIQFTRTGIASDADIGNLYLYDNGTKLAEYNSFSDKVVTFVNSNGLFTVPAGTTKAINLKGDLARGSTSVTSGKTIGFNLASVNDVTTDGASITGAMPITGNIMSTAAVSDLGHVYFAGASGSNGTIPATIKADEADKQLWSVNVTADSQDMEIQYLKYTMVGTVAVTDIQNIRLEVAGVEHSAAIDMASDKTLIYDLSDNPISINSGVTKAIALRGDMAGGAGRVFKFTIQKSADVLVYDTNYGIYTTPNVNSQSTAFGVVQQTTGNGTTVSAGTITCGVATDSPTGNIPDAANAVTLGKFSFYAAGEDVKVDNLSITCNGSDATDYLDNVKLLLDGTQVGTTGTTLLCDDTETEAFTFGNTFIVPQGETKYLTVVADTTDSTIAAAATFNVDLVVGSANAIGQNTMTSLSTTAQAARTLTAQSGQVTIIENTAFGDRNSTTPTGTVSAPEAQIASFIITAGAGEAVDVSQITLEDDTTATIQFLGDNFQNLKIKHAGAQIGNTDASLNTAAGTYTFTPSTPIRIEAGAQYIVDVYADVKSSVDDSATSLSPVVVVDASGVTATGVTTGADASMAATAVDLQDAYISAQGQLTITADGDTPVAQQMVMGETDKEVARFKLAADAAEDINITEVYVAATVASTATGTFQNMKLYVDDVQVGSAANFGSTASTTYAIAPFTSLDLTIPRNSNKILVVKADVSTSADSTSADTATFALLPYYIGVASESITAKGASSGLAVSGTNLDFTANTDAVVSGSEMTVYGSKLTVAFASDTPSGSEYATGGDDQVIAKITVSNAANVGNYAATVKYMNFAISQSGCSRAAATAIQLKVYKNGAVNSANLVATTSWAAAANENIGNTSLTNGSSSSTNFVSTEISAGGEQTFIVTMETQSLSMSADTGAESISIGMAADDLGWTDGVGSSDITAVNSLPLTAKTLSYPSS